MSNAVVETKIIENFFSLPFSVFLLCWYDIYIGIHKPHNTESHAIFTQHARTLTHKLDSPNPSHIAKCQRGSQSLCFESRQPQIGVSFHTHLF